MHTAVCNSHCGTYNCLYQLTLQGIQLSVTHNAGAHLSVTRNAGYTSVSDTLLVYSCMQLAMQGIQAFG